MKSLLKKLTFSFLTALIVFVSVAPNLLTAKAAKTAAAPTATTAPTWYNSSFQDWYGKVYDPNNPSEIFGERYTAAQVQWVFYGIFGFLINTVTGPQNAGIVQCFMNNVKDISTCTTQLQKLVDRTDAETLALKTKPATNQSLASLVFADRPLSGISYVREKVQNFSLVPVAHAAPATLGFGFNALSPVQGMWTAFRDIAFGLFVLVAIVFSFMIMFRVKLSPQTVISVQSALPKIITALVLVTFSYAIAGFLVDLMYVVIGLVSLAAAQIFSVSVGFVGVGANQYFNLMTVGQPFGYDVQLGVLGLLMVFYVIFFLPLLILLLLAGLLLLAIPGVGVILYFLFAALVFIVVILIALWIGIKIIWSLLKAFVNIILLTIFAPIQIGLGTIIPSLGFGQWLRSFASNLAVFVVTGALFLFALLFIIEAIVIGFTGPNIPPGLASAILRPLLGAINPALPAFVGGSPWPPLLGTGSSQWVGLMFLGVSFVLFTLIPKANEIIQGLLSGKPFAYGSAVGEAFGGVAAAYGATGAKDYVSAIQSLRQSRMWSNLLNTKPGKQVTKTLIGGEVEKGKSQTQTVIDTMSQNKRH